MSEDTPHKTARFNVGQLIHHKMFDYRGVIVGVDARFSLSDDWYEQIARSRPPKDAPWYHVLVHGAEHTTYVAERNLEPDESREPVEHPLVAALLGEFENGRYLHREIVH